MGWGPTCDVPAGRVRWYSAEWRTRNKYLQRGDSRSQIRAQGSQGEMLSREYEKNKRYRGWQIDIAFLEWRREDSEEERSHCQLCQGRVWTFLRNATYLAGSHPQTPFGQQDINWYAKALTTCRIPFDCKWKILHEVIYPTRVNGYRSNRYHDIVHGPSIGWAHTNLILGVHGGPLVPRHDFKGSMD